MVPTALALAALTLPALAGGPNLITNGNFEDRALTGVFSDYLNTPQGNVDEGTWWISPWQPGGPWDAAQRPGSMGKMNVNGDNSTQAGVRRVWFQTISVTPGVEHVFELWALGTSAGCAGYTLEFAVDNTVISGTFCPAANRTYERHAATFTPATSTVTVSLRNVSGITFPNDFIIDDIAVFATGPLPCNAADFSPAFGTLDINDVLVFAAAFNAGEAAADLAPEGGVFDINDILIFAGVFGAGCP